MQLSPSSPAAIHLIIDTPSIGIGMWAQTEIDEDN